MKASEMRIGNWVNKSNLDKSVIRDYQIGVHDLCQWENSHYKPIPLTEEWLVKFGYKVEFYGGQGNIGYSVFVKGLGRLFSHDGLIWHPSMALGNFFKAECQYVHQLQNLYFTLTGQELTPLQVVLED